jgi:hypothetical protein
MNNKYKMIIIDQFKQCVNILSYGLAIFLRMLTNLYQPVYQYIDPLILIVSLMFIIYLNVIYQINLSTILSCLFMFGGLLSIGVFIFAIIFVVLYVGLIMCKFYGF